MAVCKVLKETARTACRMEPGQDLSDGLWGDLTDAPFVSEVDSEGRPGHCLGVSSLLIPGACPGQCPNVIGEVCLAAC